MSALILLRHLTVCLINTFCTSLKLIGSRTNCWELETFLLENSNVRMCDILYSGLSKLAGLQLLVRHINF